MPADLASLTLNVSTGLEADIEERTTLVRMLRKELSDLPDVQSLDFPRSAADPKSKAPGIDWQTLIVTLAASGGVLTTLISTVQTCLTRHERTSVTLEIGGDKLTITGASPESQNRLVSSWIDRHKQ